MLISLTGTAGLLLLAAPQMLGMELAGLPTLAFVNGSIIRYDAERIANFNEAVALVNTDRIFPGVTIDGINVGGMTRADAESALGRAAWTTIASTCMWWRMRTPTTSRVTTCRSTAT